MKLEGDLLTARPHFIVHPNTFISCFLPVESTDSREPTIKRAQSLFLLLYTSLRNINLFEQSCRLFSNCPFNFHFFHFFHLTARIEEQLHRIGELFLLFYISFSSVYRFFRFPCLPSLLVLFFPLPPPPSPPLDTSFLISSAVPSSCLRQVSLSPFWHAISSSLDISKPPRFQKCTTYRYPACGPL